MDQDFIEDLIVDQTSAFDRNRKWLILRGIVVFLVPTKSYQTPTGGVWVAAA